MADLNTVVLSGRVVRDAELRYTGGGMGICEFSLAVNRRRKKDDTWVDEANFFDVTIFGKQGESLHKYLHKGTAVGVQGELRQDRWESEGQKKSKVSIISDKIHLLGSPRQNTQSAQTQPAVSHSSGTPDQKADNFDDDIPF